MKPIRFVMIVLAVCAIGHGGTLRADEPPTTTEEIEPALGMSLASNAFAIDLYKQLANENKNTIFAPYSLHAVLTAVATGAKGETAKQMQHALHLSDNDAEWAAAYTQLRAVLAPKTKSFDFTDANGLFLQKDYPVKKEWLTPVRKHFEAGIFALDFNNQELCAAQVNQWCHQNTKGIIRNMVTPQLFTPQIRFILANAVYFRAHWINSFDPKKTRSAPFTLHTARQVDAAYMVQSLENTDYTETNDAQILRLPYRKNETSMVILLPRKTDGLTTLEKKLTIEYLAKISSSLQPQKVFVGLLRMDLQMQHDNLIPHLKSLGMTDAFDTNKANFTGIADEPGIHVQLIAQKVYTRVYEEGTEAAAVTVDASFGGEMPTPKPTVRFVTDRPFLFLIQHEATGAILFMGRMVNP